MVSPVLTIVLSISALLLGLLLGLVPGYRQGLRAARRHQASAEPGQRPLTLVPPTPTSDPPSLFDRRLHYLYRVIEDPEAALALTDDPYVHDIVERGISSRAELFTVAAAREAHAEQRCFANDPANTYRAYLHAQFRQRGLKWPRSVDAWEYFFLK